MTRAFTALFAIVICFSAAAATIDQDVLIEGHVLRVGLNPQEGGAIDTFSLMATGLNMSGGEGIAQEGFGVGSYYVPNRRLNESVQSVDTVADRPVLVYSYDCDGPNIKGLHVSRKMEPLPDEASVRVTWTIENRGDERQYVAPWVRHEVSAGGTTGPEDRIDLPTFSGIVQPTETRWHPASRNWGAITDTKNGETFYCVFNADHLHSLLSIVHAERNVKGFQAAFVPRILNPGESWQTIYRLNAVRGLKRVDFATDEFAAQFDYATGTLTALMASVKSMPEVQMVGRVVAGNGRVWDLSTKQFTLAPGKLIRATYAWDAPGEDAYEFMGQLKAGEEIIDIGIETASPHGGVDTQFVVGTPKTRTLEAWTDAPYALEHQGRTLKRTLAAKSPVPVWFESSLFKVFPKDRVAAGGVSTAPGHRVSLAQGERESFQMVLRPEERDLSGVRLTVSDLSGEAGTIAASNVSVFEVDYVDVRIPSHFEGPTGLFPDPLRPHQRFNAMRGRAWPLWLTVYAPRGTAPGLYRGTMTLSDDDGAPVEFPLEVRVYGFELPAASALKTDFGFWAEEAVRGARMQGASGDAKELAGAYLENALEHRVTLRELSSFPRESSNYASALAQFEPVMRQLLAEGATALSVPASLLQRPEQLAQANAFVKQHKLQGRVFTQLSHEPLPPAWDRVLESMTQWKAAAPDIPVMVTTFGMQPFIPETLDIWALHAQSFDTVHNKQILEHIAEGNEVWWYVNHTPPRPYGNFLLDFAAIEHRILFWQTWALGLRGLHYWGINYFPEGDDPYRSLLDFTPVNGDGFLVYPGAAGPVNSIRWECIRDGIEDYDYLALFRGRQVELARQGGQEALLARAAKAYDLGDVVPSLVSFTREHEVLERKRDELAAVIEEMERALR